MSFPDILPVQDAQAVHGGLLTIVVPAYNVERYIGDCLGSLFPQCTRYGVDVVIVVDGATDGTLAKIDAAIAAWSFGRARVICQQNQGLSAARNRGLREVRTEYVCFLDSDDYLVEGFLDEVVPLLASRQPDIIEFDAAKVDDANHPLGTLKITPVRDGEVRQISHREFLSCFRCYAWARVVRTVIARKHPFPEGHRFEDAGTIPWYYRDSSCMLGIGKPLVGYRQRSGSILASPVAKDVLDLAHAVRNAAGEFLATRDCFWQVVANRIHQVACGRVPLLPLTAWGECIDALGTSIEGVPPTRGALRWLQVRATYLYVLLLSVKRMLRTSVPGTEPKLFGRSAA